MRRLHAAGLQRGGGLADAHRAIYLITALCTYQFDPWAAFLLLQASEAKVVLTDTRATRLTLQSMLGVVLGHTGDPGTEPMPEFLKLSQQITIWQVGLALFMPAGLDPCICP